MNEDDDVALAEAIGSAGTVSALGHACHAIASALDFEHFLYGFRVPFPLDQPCQFILSGYPAPWMQRYDEQRYLAVDPVLQRGLTSVVPFAWDELERADPRVEQLFEEAAEHGLRHGVSVAVHGAHGEGGLMSMAREQPLTPHVLERQRLYQRFQWLVALVHQRLRQVVFTDSDPPQLRPLSPRERECLLLAAEGHSAGEIGRDMKITERTVVFHLNRAEEKLGARRRQEAVARGVALGAIEPKLYPERLNESHKLVQIPKTDPPCQN